MHKTILKNTLKLLVLAAAVAFVIRFAGYNMLRQYISYGIGDCRDIPILCATPGSQEISCGIDEGYRSQLVAYSFPLIKVSCPKGFSVVQELIKKPYYKSRKSQDRGAIIYLLYQEPGSFVKLYPDVRKHGVHNNYEFIRRLQFASPAGIRNINDAFFVIMKSIWMPDIGNQKIARSAPFQSGGKRGFINYSLSRQDNYFDCNIIDEEDNYFKLYIRDRGARLDLNKLCAIISTLKAANNPEPVLKEVKD